MNIFDAMAQGYGPAASIENTRMTTALQRELGLLAHKLGLDQLEVEKMLGLRSADTADKRADTELTLGQGQLDLGKDKLAADTRLGEGRLNLDQQLGLGKLNLDSSLGFGELGNQRYLGELGANTQNIGNILDLMGTMDQSSASRYGADQTLAGVLQRALADQNIQRMRGETDLGVANISNQPALMAEQNKQGRFGAMTDFVFPMLTGVLGGLGFSIPEQAARAEAQQEPDNALLAELGQLRQQIESMNNQRGVQERYAAMGADPSGYIPPKAFTDPKNQINEPTPIVQKTLPPPQQQAFNPAALLGMLGQMPQPPQMQPPPSFAPAPVMPSVPPPPAQPTPTGKTMLSRGPNGDTRTAIMKPPPQNRSPVYQGGQNPQRRGPIIPEFQQVVPFRA